MQFSLALLTLAASSLAAYVPSEPWSTLTPDSVNSCAQTDYTKSFGIAIATISAEKQKRNVLTQIGDGQIQAAAPTGTTAPVIPSVLPSTTTKSQITHSSSASSTQSSASSCATGAIVPKQTSCAASGVLALTLKDGVLTDSKGRLGAIVANRQFQFDGPPPQAGSIYAAGWGIVDGHLSLGEEEVFYQCLSGDFYNLYDQSIAEQCSPVHLNIVELKDC